MLVSELSNIERLAIFVLMIIADDEDHFSSVQINTHIYHLREKNTYAVRILVHSFTIMYQYVFVHTLKNECSILCLLL